MSDERELDKLPRPGSDPKWIEDNCPQLLRDIESSVPAPATAAPTMQTGVDLANGKDRTAYQANCLRCGKLEEVQPSTIGGTSLPICRRCLDEMEDEDIHFVLRCANWANAYQYRRLRPHIDTLESAIAVRDKALRENHEQHNDDQARITELLKRHDADEVTEANLRATMNYWMERCNTMTAIAVALREQRTKLYCWLGVAVVIAITAFIF